MLVINAIEQNYALPDRFQNWLRTIEFEKRRAKTEVETEIQRREKDSQISACQVCDENGRRIVKLSEDGNYKAVHVCSHDAEIESKFEDWQ